MRRMLVAALFLTAPTCLTRPASAGQMTYLSLGDSIAFGETDFQHNPSAGDRGYVKLYDQYLAGQNGGVAPKVVNLAIDGETSSSFMSTSGRVPPASGISDAMLASYNTHYGNTAISQNTKLIQTIGNQMAQGNTVSNVTISLGANDLFTMAGTPGFLTASPADQQAMLAATLGKFATNYANILAEVKALVPNAHVSLLGEYNPFPATPSNPLNAVAAPAIQGLNATIKGLAKAFGADYVDTYSAFVGREADLTHMVDIPGDVHPNAKGYAAIATQVEAVPEPSSLAVLGLGGVSLALGARRRMRASASA